MIRTFIFDLDGTLVETEELKALSYARAKTEVGLAATRDPSVADLSVLVLEARDRVGGRVLNDTLKSGAVVEVGGQWVGPTQERILPPPRSSRWVCASRAWKASTYWMWAAL